MITLYHRTTPEKAAAIMAERRMISRENTGEIYVSNRKEGQGEGYGEGIVTLRVPAELVEIDDEFPDGECHYRIRAASLRPEHFINGKG